MFRKNYVKVHGGSNGLDKSKCVGSEAGVSVDSELGWTRGEGSV